VVRTRLWTWWDTATLLAYETVAVAIALLVPSGWQFAIFIVAIVILGVAIRWLLRHTERGARIRASQPSEAVSAPTWLMFLSGLALALPVAFLLDALGAGGSYGWTMIAAGSWIVSFRVADRWWTARVGTAT
jgi:hypothetical protein